jgi:hypothetical protein
VAPVEIWARDRARGPVLRVARSESMHVGAPNMSTNVRARANYVTDHVLKELISEPFRECQLVTDRGQQVGVVREPSKY